MLTVALLGLLAAEPPLAPLPSALFKAVSEAAALVEVEVPLEATGRPFERWAKGLAKAKVTATLASRAPDDAPTAVPRWEVLRSCLARLGPRTSVRVMLAVSDHRLVLLPMTTLGFALETTPGYADAKAAMVASFGWREERMRAVPPEQLWLEQRAALRSENAYLRHLAAEFLIQHDAGDVVDEAWGAQGTEARGKNEEASSVVPRC
jgi:hypothetical protein